MDGQGSLQYVPNSGFVGLDTISYEVCDNDSLCDTGFVYVVVSLTPGVGKTSESLLLNIYPNPSSGLINIEGLGQYINSVSLELYDVNGKKIWNEHRAQGITGPYQLDLSNHPNGTYFLNLIIGERTFAKKLVILK